MQDKELYESLSTINEYLHELTTVIEQTIEVFKQQKEDVGLKLLIKIIDGLSWTIEAVFSLKPELEEHGFDSEVEQVNDMLMELLKAIENEDFVLISDILEYEVLEVLTSWQNVISKIVTN